MILCSRSATLQVCRGSTRVAGGAPAVTRLHRAVPAMLFWARICSRHAGCRDTSCVGRCSEGAGCSGYSVDFQEFQGGHEVTGETAMDAFSWFDAPVLNDTMLDFRCS